MEVACDVDNPLTGAHGAAAVYGPPDKGFPENGVIAIGAMDAAQWVFADANLDAIAGARSDGLVLNHRRWSDQPGASPLLPPSIVSLR